MANKYQTGDLVVVDGTLICEYMGLRRRGLHVVETGRGALLIESARLALHAARESL